MTFTPEQKSMLSAKLDMGHVRSRKQGGADVQYIEGWFAIAEANRIFGFDRWTSETLDLQCVGQNKTAKGKDEVHYIAKVRVTVGDVIREGVGYGNGFGNSIGEAHELAVKEAETDARKRALMTFGNPFGLALYDKDRGNVCDNAAEERTRKAEQTRDDLVRSINDCDNEPDLIALVNDVRFKEAVDALPDNNKREVRSTYKVKLTAIQKQMSGDVVRSEAAE